MMTVTADMLISDVLRNCPGAVGVFERFGLACAACLASSMEPVEAIASGHDISVVDLIAELNALDDDSCASGEES